jgi:hypothetical protein
VRAVALLAAGTAAVHQLRYAIGYGSDAGHALASQGHAYFDVLLPFVAALGLVALASIVRAPIARPDGPRRSFARTWAIVVAALVTAYAAQELLEGVLASGHPPGLAGVFATGGWTAVPLALPVGLLVALGLRGDAPLTAVAPERARPRPLAFAPVVLLAAAGEPSTSTSFRLLPARGPPLSTVR